MSGKESRSLLAPRDTETRETDRQSARHGALPDINLLAIIRHQQEMLEGMRECGIQLLMEFELADDLLSSERAALNTFRDHLDVIETWLAPELGRVSDKGRMARWLKGKLGG